ncbi:hypothetical protein [Prosthecomicrobium sp. N25]|uniref:hypothetical protein n=1 Tax=Prosthecomicrobium sp. N25 TaxID=3129254 RepID=UPI0030772E7F
MALKRLEITNYEQLGKLTKTWALKQDRVQNGGVYLPKPKTLEEFLAMLVKAGATTKANCDAWLASFQGKMKKIRFVQSTESTLVVRLPMARMLKESEKWLEEGGYYKLPGFYSPDFFDGAPEEPKQGPGEAMRLHAERIGDYTIAQCV